jgi:hypothetical protein
MTQQERLTQWLEDNIVWPRVASEFHTALFYNRFEDFSPYSEPRPTAQELADELLGLAEFRALQLGTWLGTPEGEMFATAVEAVSPPFYRTDIELLVDALKLASTTQQKDGLKRAIAIGAISVAIIGFGFSGSRAA